MSPILRRSVSEAVGSAERPVQPDATGLVPQADRLAGTGLGRTRKVYRHRAVDSLAADIRGRQSWRGHLSLVSHELLDRADLRDDVEVFIHQLDIAHPSY